MLKIGWLTTGRGPGSRGFFETVQNEVSEGKLDARIEFVFVNRDRGEAAGSDDLIDLVESHDIPLVTLSSRRFRREHGGGPFARHRLPFHRQAVRLLESFDPDVCVMAGYLLFSETEVVDRWPTINLHPAAPWGPAGMWQDVIWDAIDKRAAESGVRVHVATSVLDEGPLLTYCTYPIRGPEFDPLWRDFDGRIIDDLMAEGEGAAALQRDQARRIAVGAIPATGNSPRTGRREHSGKEWPSGGLGGKSRGAAVSERRDPTVSAISFRPGALSDPVAQ